MSEPSVAYYCVTGRDFFPGAVALLNSLRLLGHEQPFHVCDCGMTPRQRAMLEGHVTLIEAPAGAAPSAQKLVAPRAAPAAVMVLLDADLIFTRRIDALLDHAAAGGVIAFENDVDRRFDEWSDLLDLPAIRPGPYMTSSAIFAGGEHGAHLIDEIAARLQGIDPARTWVGGGDPSDPLYLLDQDVFNAVARSTIPAERLETLPAELAPIPPFAGVRIADPSTLRCRGRDGTEPYALHHASYKPWLVSLRSNVYSRLLTRLLLAADVRVRLDASDLPPRLGTGPRAALARAATDLRLALPGVARRLRSRPEPIPAWPHEGGP
jgi:hypothetical protein